MTDSAQLETAKLKAVGSLHVREGSLDFFFFFASENWERENRVEHPQDELGLVWVLGSQGTLGSGLAIALASTSS